LPNGIPCPDITTTCLNALIRKYLSVAFKNRLQSIVERKKKRVGAQVIPLMARLLKLRQRTKEIGFTLSYGQSEHRLCF